MFLRPLVHLHGSIVMQYSVILFIIMYVCRTEYYMFKNFPLQFYSYSKYQLYDEKLDLNSKMIFFQILTKNWTMVSFFESNQDKIRPLCAMQQHSWCWYAAVVLNEVFVSWSKAIQTFSSHFSLVRNLYHRELIFGRVIYVQFYLHFKISNVCSGKKSCVARQQTNVWCEKMVSEVNASNVLWPLHQEVPCKYCKDEESAAPCQIHHFHKIRYFVLHC